MNYFPLSIPKCTTFFHFPILLYRVLVHFISHTSVLPEFESAAENLSLINKATCLALSCLVLNRVLNFYWPSPLIEKDLHRATSGTCIDKPPTYFP